MATTVNQAFKEFLDNTINISKSTYERAKSSRDNLRNNIHTFSNQPDFMTLYQGADCYFGSFSRKTRIRPLSDIDMMIGISGNATNYSKFSWNNIKMTVKDPNSLLNNFTGNFGYLNSTKIKNAFKNKLAKLHDYSNAEIKSNGESISLELKSYPWTYDIVPCFSCDEGYLIPNGYGDWKLTNPRKEQERLSRVNQKHDGKIIELIRLIKYWNKRGKMPRVTSYVLETLVVQYYEKLEHQAGYFIDWMFRDILKYISDNIYYAIYDSKGIEGDINNLFFSDKEKLRTRAFSDYKKACDAINAESNRDIYRSINIWRDILGEEFPKYE